jgi:hypothetical protein
VKGGWNTKYFLERKGPPHASRLLFLAVDVPVQIGNEIIESTHVVPFGLLSLDDGFLPVVEFAPASLVLGIACKVDGEPQCRHGVCIVRNRHLLRDQESEPLGGTGELLRLSSPFDPRGTASRMDSTTSPGTDVPANTP